MTKIRKQLKNDMNLGNEWDEDFEEIQKKFEENMDKKLPKKRKLVKKSKLKRSSQTESKNQTGIAKMLTENIQDYIKGIIGSSDEDDEGEFEESSHDNQIKDAPVSKRTRSWDKNDFKKIPKKENGAKTVVKKSPPLKEDNAKQAERKDAKLEESQTKDLPKVIEIYSENEEPKLSKEDKSLAI